MKYVTNRLKQLLQEDQERFTNTLTEIPRPTIIPTDEDRWVTLGLVNGQHYLSVIHTYHDQHNNAVTIRLISARLATKHEIRDYEG